MSTNDLRRWMQVVEGAGDRSPARIIQQALSSLPDHERAPYSDALDLIKGAGQITPADLAVKMQEYYPGFDATIKRVIGEIVDLVPDVVRHERGMLVWSPDHPPQAADAAPGESPRLRTQNMELLRSLAQAGH